MSKQKIASLVFFSVLIVAGGFFAWKKMMNSSRQSVIGNQQDSIINIQQTTDNNQNATDNIQDSIGNNQNAIDNNQDKTGNVQNIKSIEQKVQSIDQNATNNKQNSTDRIQQVVVSKNAETGKIVQRLASWGFQKASDRKIDTIILHSSYDALGKDPFSVAGVIAEYKQAQVAPHYLIARDGTIYQLVADQNIAWHAGVAKMPDGRTNVNSFSLGIEIINTKDGKFTAEQYDAINWLIGDLKKTYPIKNILGHSDIAPDRKTDPWGIDWKKIDR